MNRDVDQWLVEGKELISCSAVQWEFEKCMGKSNFEDGGIGWLYLSSTDTGKNNYDQKNQKKNPKKQE